MLEQSNTRVANHIVARQTTQASRRLQPLSPPEIAHHIYDEVLRHEGAKPTQYKPQQRQGQEPVPGEMRQDRSELVKGEFCMWELQVEGNSKYCMEIVTGMSHMSEIKTDRVEEIQRP